MKPVEAVLEQVREVADGADINLWTAVNEAREQAERVTVWERGAYSAMAGRAHRANLRATLVLLAAHCVATVAALDAPPAKEQK